MRRAFCSIILVLVLFSSACKLEPQKKNVFENAGPAMVVSVSSDGRYAISSHQDNRLILWDIKGSEKKIISTRANIYSAYFVPGHELFLWQDLNNIVHFQRVTGEISRSFEHFPTYGHVLSSDLEKYVSCDQGWNLYLGHGEAIKPIKEDGESPSFIGVGKLLNLAITPDNRYLLSAGDGGLSPEHNPSFDDHPPTQKGQIFSNYAGVLLWDLTTLLPIRGLPGNAAKTTATLSPDGHWAVSGDENTLGYVWNAQTGERHHRLASIYHGIWNENQGEEFDDKTAFNREGLIPLPKDWDVNIPAILAIKFIDASHYLCFITYSPYAILYHVDNPLPLKYLSLGRDPFPAVSDYSRNAAIDTAPDAGILVTGQRDGGGIIVYRYNSAQQELEKVWVGN